ncbi:hypothetical protein GCM10019059_31960 [Camelimonas fluminis]|uniref:DUF2612 domain-containing protein n=1 Tax=Camelimonas fluminis TaxID=1576911 RepID=A0ABV7UHN1_9HYPH|nr:DUF2612 domain-containing protein [Camelimonas fluminis]GHE69844.1 hypothetical protein GCM10019059_31960 [Camelimonas fluminis]
MATVEDYLGLITSFHRGQPRFTATVEALVTPLAGGQAFLGHMPQDFDLDDAVGVQLDVVGEWVGRSRYIELDLENVWFSFDLSGLGFDQGVWQGKYDPTTGLTALDDDNYRLLLRAKIAANSWDGTVPGAKRAFDIMFEGTGTLVFVQDNHDMTMTIGVSGAVPNALFLAILAGGYIPLKPEGVRIAYYDITSIDGGPMFGFDSSSPYLTGFDAGAWGVPA